MHDLIPLAALGAKTPKHDTIGAITIAEIPDVALASVAVRRGQSGPCAAALADWLGCTAPDTAQHAGGDKTAFWIGPDMWMLEASLATHETLAHDLEQGLQGLASVTEQTDAWARFDLSGVGLDNMLALLSNLDFAALPGQFARRTVVEHVGCFLLRRGAGYSLYGPRSSAGSLHHALILAARSVEM